MVQENTNNNDPVVSTAMASSTPNSTYNDNNDDLDKNRKDEPYRSYPSDTVAAVTIAILAVIVIISMLIVFRALRKRQRARQGERFGQNVIPTVTTGVMGTGGAAYATSLNSVPTRGAVRWESINPASSEPVSNGGENGATAAASTR